MEKTIQLKPIGKVISENGMFVIELQKEYLPALTNIEGFSHLQILWWGNLYDSPESRKILIAKKPYKKGPETLGIFATRSPVRPNPVLITTIQ
ncbi:MAG TPA: TrmO family methyltransferase, partial [Prolixibacteraceae bacterium]|nr:TrmO family methyltransferase [Prolixibacteraceae bacterium]